MVLLYVFRFQAALGQPLRHRHALIQDRPVRQAALEGIVETVRTGGKSLLAHRHHVDAQTGGQLQRPTVFRYSGNDVAARQCPVAPHEAVFYPKFRVRGLQRHFHFGILHEHGRMGFSLAVHDFPLVRHDVLHGQCGRNHLAARPVMIEIPPFQRQDGHRQAVQLRVVQRRTVSQCQTELGVHVVKRQLPVTVRTLHHQFHRPVAQQPNPDVHQEQMLAHQCAQLGHTGFLQHESQPLRRPAVRYEHPMVLSQARVYPQPIAHHVGFGDVLQRPVGTDIHVATGHQRVQRLRRTLHNLLVKGQLKRQKVLIQTLSPLPPEHRYRSQYFPRRRVSRQTSALPSGMQQDAFLTRQPCSKCFSFIRLGLLAGLQQPRRSSPRT